MSSAECIHGFDAGLCDICYPKTPVARPAVSAVRAGAVRATPGSRAQASRTPATKVPPTNLLDQRVFHVTHLRNLEGIVGAGGLVAGERPEVDLTSELGRELRATAEVAAGSPVSEYVPWYVSPDAEVWNELRRGAAEPRWSSAARAAASVDLVVLVSTVRALGNIVVADGDAAGTYTRFATDTEQSMRMLARLHNTDQARAAEVLVKGSVPFEAVQLIGVANEPQRDRVRALLDAADLRTKVSVYPPWFAVVE